MVVALYPSLLSVRLRDRQPTTLMVRHADDPVNEREGERERERERERAQLELQEAWNGWQLLFF